MNLPDADTGLPFMKWHGAGNDFVIIDSRGDSARDSARDSAHDSARVTKSLARALGDRHKGVGFDQLAEIRRSDVADIDLDFWNADGSRAGACGNATRCVAQFIMGETGREALTIRTGRGLLEARLEGGEITVNMGQPQLDWRAVPLAEEVDILHLPIKGDPAAIGMGNPHCIFFVKDSAAEDVAGRGAAMEHHGLFPEATNVEFAQIVARDHIRLRVWERGTGITLACGSGACATLVAAAQRGLTDRRARIEVDGGWLAVDWRKDGLWLSGPTLHVFSATLSAAFLANLS